MNWPAATPGRLSISSMSRPPACIVADVHRLVKVLDKLVDAGNTVIVIEHNLDVIKRADYIIDLGPEGGSGGGTIVATGTPEEVAQNPNPSPGNT